MVDLQTSSQNQRTRVASARVNLLLSYFAIIPTYNLLGFYV